MSHICHSSCSEGIGGRIEVQEQPWTQNAKTYLKKYRKKKGWVWAHIVEYKLTDLLYHVW
jgi:hypothetical protein